MSRMITLAEFDTHNKPTDAWLLFDGRVLDVSTFQHEHPGGPDVLLECVGKDATSLADFHSAEAKDLMRTFAIGVLCDADLGVVRARG